MTNVLIDHDMCYILDSILCKIHGMEVNSNYSCMRHKTHSNS
jgi:hypothetical protein